MKRRLPLALQVLYGIGEIPITLTMGLVGYYLLAFYTSVMGLNGALAGFGITAGLIVDALVDPYIGFRSDAARFQLGRRQSFMLAGCLGMGPFLWALFSPPRGLSTTELFAWLLVSSLGFRFSSALYRIPYLSLGAELTTDYAERTRIISIRSLLGLAGLGAAALLPLLVLFPRNRVAEYSGYPRMGFAFGAVMIAAGLVAVFGTQSHRTFAGEGHPAEKARHFFSGMWLFLKNRDFRALWLAFMLSLLPLVVTFTLNLSFLKWYAGIQDNRWLGAIQIGFFTGAVVGVAGWIWVAKRGEKRNFFAGSIVGLCTILVLATVLVGKGHLLGTNNPVPLLVGNVFAGLFASALWVLPFSMMADVADEDHLVSGTRREGTCFGIMNFGDKIATGGAVQLSGLLLAGFIHLAPGSAQTAETVSRIGISYGVVPGLLLSLAVAFILQFSLTRKRVAEIQSRLEH